ncbi:MAG: hypothetical protein OEV01_14845 [Nitrospira sp.]|nr:hypothetical protein [Nitrospira sp.]MDH4303856.1 hypothetical protein [Nitrospira sp.]MDH5194981.1 hypothetical protein [Nitrospira sp.]
MRDLCRWSKLLGLVLVVLLVPGCEPSQPHQSNDTTTSLKEQSPPVEYLNKRLIEVFGPLPAIASTPFLGLAVLTGTALLVEEPVFANSELRLVQQIRRNSLILQAKPYASWWLFGTFTSLAGLTWLANSGKLRGTFGKFVRIAEDIAVGLLYLMVGADTLMPNTGNVGLPELHPAIVLAGIVPALESSTAILILAALISLVTMMLTRLALDVLIWLSPVPFIDMIFETCKVLFSLAFLAIYFFLSPLVAAMLSLLLLVPCFLLLPWAIRLLHFGYRIVLCPILAQWSPAFVPQLIEPALAQKAGGDGVTLACPAWVLKARGFKKRETVALYRTSSQRTVRPQHAKRRARTLCHAEEEVLLGRALAWIELRVINREGQLLDHYALPLSMMGNFERLLALLGAKDGGAFGVMKILHTMGTGAERASSL